MSEQLYLRTAEMDRQIGASVRAARLEAGFSQSRLASELGITFQQLQKYERGRNRIAAGTLLLIADALSTTVHRFFEAVRPGAGGSLATADGGSPDALRLVAAFDRIADPEIRRRILTLVVAVNDGRQEPFGLADVVAASAVAAS